MEQTLCTDIREDKYMNQYALVDINGEIVSIVMEGIPKQFEHGKAYGNQTAILLEGSVDTSTFAATHWWDKDHPEDEPQWRTRDARPDENHIWDGKWTFDRTKFELAVRTLRNQKLYACDWTQTADSPLSSSKKTEWTTYRQALRDFPANIASDITLMEQLVWPTAPS